MKLRTLLFLFLGYTGMLYSQDIQTASDVSTDGLKENYQIKDNNQYTFVVNYSTNEESIEDQVADLISTAIAVYLDKSFQIGDQKLIFTYQPIEMMLELNSLANQGLAIFQIHQKFDRFSPSVLAKLKSLDNLSWTKSEYELLGDSPKEQEETLDYLLSVEVFDLKQLCQSEISSFLKSIEKIEIPKEWVDKLDDGDSKVLTYSSKDFIDPLEFTFDEKIIKEDQEFESTLSTNFEKELKKQKRKNRKQKDQFSQDVLALLKQNSEQLISIQRDILGFRKENAERDQEFENESANQIAFLQKQIDELKEYLYSDNKEAKDLHVYKNMDEVVLTIYFDKNAKDLNEKCKLELNSIFGVLIKNSSLKIMITGFADKTGDPDYNSYLSKERAKEVRNYLYTKGIPKKRMLMNYLGDISSASENANDRRVEIEFINEIGQIELSAN